MTRLDHSSPWRYECPNGHVNIFPRQTGTIRCRTCKESVPYCVDKKTGRKVTI